MQLHRRDGRSLTDKDGREGMCVMKKLESHSTMMCFRAEVRPQGIASGAVLISRRSTHFSPSPRRRPTGGQQHTRGRCDHHKEHLRKRVDSQEVPKTKPIEIASWNFKNYVTFKIKYLKYCLPRYEQNLSQRVHATCFPWGFVWLLCSFPRWFCTSAIRSKHQGWFREVKVFPRGRRPMKWMVT